MGGHTCSNSSSCRCGAAPGACRAGAAPDACRAVANALFCCSAALASSQRARAQPRAKIAASTLAGASSSWSRCPRQCACKALTVTRCCARQQPRRAALPARQTRSRWTSWTTPRPLRATRQGLTASCAQAGACQSPVRPSCARSAFTTPAATGCPARPAHLAIPRWQRAPRRFSPASSSPAGERCYKLAVARGSLALQQTGPAGTAHLTHCVSPAACRVKLPGAEDPQPCDKGFFCTGGSLSRPAGTMVPCDTGTTTQADESNSPQDCNGEQQR